MIKFVTSPMGWGKTYYAVNDLLDSYRKKNRPIFTNINMKIPYDDYLMPFDFNDFHEFCKKELEFFYSFRNAKSEFRKSNIDDFFNDDNYFSDIPDNYDDELKNSGLLDKYGSALIIWDECQTDLEKLDPYILRFFIYHRHLEDMDVILITPDIGLIERKYRRLGDTFVAGQSPTKRLFSSTFEYKEYNNHRMYEKHLTETVSLPLKKDVFSIYDSGGYKNRKSVIFKKLAPVLALVVFLAFFVKYVLFGIVLGGNKEDINIPSDVPSVNDPFREEVPSDGRTLEDMKSDALNDGNDSLLPPPALVQGSSVPPQSYDNQSALSRHLIRFQCSSTYCYFSGNRFTIPLNSMERFLEEFNGKILSAEMLNRDISLITALVPSELYYMIESHNIVSRSDNYGPQSQKNSFSNNSLTSPQFATPTGI